VKIIDNRFRFVQSICVWCAVFVVGSLQTTLWFTENRQRSQSELHSARKLPLPGEKYSYFNEADTVPVLDRSTSEAEFDKLLGPRVKNYERIHGPRIQIAGRATYFFKGGSQILGTASTPFHLKVVEKWDRRFEWPKELIGRIVVADGHLCRVYYPRELSQLDTSKWTADEKQKRNNVRAYPLGFVYELRDFNFRPSDNAADAGEYELAEEEQ
jgi:hypothetical protein